MNRRHVLSLLAILFAVSTHAPRAVAAVDWDPITDADKTMKASPLDPGAGAVVLFKRGQMDVIEQSSLFWTTRIQTYVRIKVFNDAGRDAANIMMEHEKLFRVSKVDGRTILPSGEIIPLDSTKVFNGTVYQEGKHFALLATSFTLPSVVPGAIIEYQVEEYVDGFFPPPWIFDSRAVGTVQSSLRVTIGPRLAMSQFPLETTQNKVSVTRSNTVKGEQFDFTVQNIRPIVDEPFAPPFRDQAVMVLFTPTQLAFGGAVYPLITKWDDVGNVMKDQLGKMESGEKDARSKAKEIAEKISDPQKKAAAIYSYLQQNIRSTSLAGILLDRPADQIITARHGDPDEINALFVLMLREEKIDADMVLVATQNWETLVRGFPNFSQFTRIITRMNFKGVAVFADPADAAAPFGELPWFDRAVQGLAVKGTKIQDATIPVGAVDDNASTTKLSMLVSKDWMAEGDQEFEVKGTEAIDYRSDLMDEAPEKLEQQVIDYFSGGNSAEVTKVTHPDFRDTSQPFVLKAHVRQKLTNEAGPGEMLLNPWVGDAYERPVFKTTVRHSGVRFEFPEKRVSVTSWQLAPEIKVEQLPKDVKVESDLGGFSHACVQNSATITCTRTYYLKKMLLNTRAEYLDAKKFFDDIAKQDQEVMVLRGQ